LKRNFISYEKFLKIQLFIIVFVDVSATAAAFVGTVVAEKSTETIIKGCILRNFS